MEDLLNTLSSMGISQSAINVQKEPSYSTKILQNLENKYTISTKNVVNKVLSLRSLYEISGLTKSDYELWIDSYENFAYFKGDEKSINNIPVSSSISDYASEIDDTQIEFEYSQKKEDAFTSSFFWLFY